MKRGIIKYFAGAALLVAASCTETQDNVIPTPGKDVSFSANLDGNKTRTVYGVETEQGDSIKVNWVEGDKIKVYGTTCSQGRQLAEYSVNTAGATDQNYATSLDKTGDTGVQWGQEATSDFYAVYPSSNNGKDFTITPGTDESVTISASIRRDQKNIFSLDNDNNKWVSFPYSTDENVLSMPDAIMYAVSKGVKNGENVDLQFTPFSTVLKFNIGGYETSLTDPTLHISEVTITAPEGVMISGDFNLTIAADGTTKVAPSSNASNQINLYPTQKGGAYAPIKKGQAMEFNVFVIPQDGMDINENWTIKIFTDGGNFTKKLKPAKAESASLIAGQIHKLNIKGTTIKDTPEFDPSKWISQIPRNVYLSELSVPGAWYSYDRRYQDNSYTGDSYSATTLTDLYQKGVRAFHIDCRLTYEKTNWRSTEGSGDLLLVCAGSDSNKNPWPANEHNPGTQVIDVMNLLKGQIKPEEYIVVVLTVAEKPLTRSGYKFGNIDPEQVLSAIANMLSTNAEALNLYTKKITPTTTVNDVLGHMIVMVNANTSDTNFKGYSSVPNTLVASASMASDTNYITGDIISGKFDAMQTTTMYWGKDDSGLTLYYHQAQITHPNTSSSTPTYDNRQSAIDNIIKQSNTIYQNNKHDGWFQIVTGGRDEDDNKLNVAKELNPYLLNKIEDKLNSSNGLAPSPVGIVLMNYCLGTDTQGQGLALVNAILQMNGKFYLNRDPNGKEWPTGSTETPVQSAKVGYSSGFNVDTENWNAF